MTFCARQKRKSASKISFIATTSKHIHFYLFIFITHPNLFLLCSVCIIVHYCKHNHNNIRLTSRHIAAQSCSATFESVMKHRDFIITPITSNVSINASAAQICSVARHPSHTAANRIKFILSPNSALCQHVPQRDQIEADCKKRQKKRTSLFTEELFARAEAHRRERRRLDGEIASLVFRDLRRV